MTFAIRQEKFEGPLDLLLTLIEERKFSVNDISLAEVAEQYLEYIKSSVNFPFGEVAAFLTVASSLILIKSRSLLPLFQLSKEEEEDIQELEKRLEIYKRVREASRRLREIFGNKILFARPAFAGLQEVFLPPEGLTLFKIQERLRDLLLNAPQKETVLPQKTVEKTVTLQEKINELKERIQKLLKANFNDIQRAQSKVEIIISFLAVLELIKQGFILAEQKENFGNIYVSRNSSMQVQKI